MGNHRELDGAQFYLSLKLKFFQTENSSCFAQNFRLLDVIVIDSAGSRRHIYSFNSTELMV